MCTNHRMLKTEADVPARFPERDPNVFWNVDGANTGSDRSHSKTFGSMS